MQVGTVKNIVKGDIGDKFPRKAGLKLDEPNPSHVLNFYDKLLSSTSTDVAKKWFKHTFPNLVILTGEDFVKEFRQNGD